MGLEYYSSLLYDMIMLFVFLGSLLYLWVNERYKYFANRGIPYDEPKFLVGSTLDMFTLKTSMAEIVESLYNKHSDKRAVGFFQGVKPVYLVRSPDLVNKVLVKNFSDFYSHGFTVDEKVNPMDGNLFLMEGNKWRTLRKKLTPTFTSGKLKWMFSIMDRTVDAFIDHLNDEVGKDIEVKDALCRLTTDVIGSCAFGIDLKSIEDPNNQFRRIGRKMFNPSLLASIKTVLRFIVPSVFIKLKLRTVEPDISDFMIELTKQTFDHRLKTGEKRNDFIQLLLQLRERGEVQMDPSELEQDDPINDPNIDSHELDDSESNKLVIDDNLLAAQLFVFFAGGFETSATGMSFVIYLFSKNPIVQDRAREEVRSIKEKYGGFTYDALKDMIYLDACIKESTRLYPPFAMNLRKCTRTCELEPGLTVTKGQTVLMSISGMQKDSTYFENPMKFYPERFLEGPPMPGTYIPFGDGPRSCIAIRFAQLEMKLTMAKLLDRFVILTCRKMEKHEPIQFEPRSFVASPRHGIWCSLSKLES